MKQAVGWKRRFLLFLRRFLNGILDAVFALLYRRVPPRLSPVVDDLLLEPAVSLAAKIRSRQVTSVDVVRAYVARIKEVNPVLNCVVDERFDEALEDAKRADTLVSSGTMTRDDLCRELPFLGVPFTTKDSVGVKGLSLTAGLAVKRGCKATVDADSVALLRAAGAVPLAVTNVPELCMWAESANPLYGRTKNPYDTRRTCGGSSGGEGSLIAAGGSVAGVGTDIGGSIRIPAFCNGIFGHKTSTGIVANGGHYPRKEETKQFSSVGPMCRYAVDLLPLLRVMAGPNALKLELDAEVDMQTVKIYYTTDIGGLPFVSPVNNELVEAQKKVLSHFERAYGIEAREVSLPRVCHAADLWSSHIRAAGGPSFCTLLADGKGRVDLPWELTKWCVGASSHTLPALLFGVSSWASGLRSAETVAGHLKTADELRKEFAEMLRADGVLVFPSGATPAAYHHQPLFRPHDAVTYTCLFNVLGLPVTQCPLGLGKNGVPLGVQIVAGLHHDRLSIAVAVEIAKAFGGWVDPGASFRT